MRPQNGFWPYAGKSGPANATAPGNVKIQPAGF